MLLVYLSTFWKLIIGLLFLLVYSQDAQTASCPKGQYLVRSHKRSGYYRSSGIHVSPTQISAYCKNYRNFKTAKLHFPHVKARKKSSLVKNFSPIEKIQRFKNNKIE